MKPVLRAGLYLSCILGVGLLSLAAGLAFDFTGTVAPPASTFWSRDGAGSARYVEIAPYGKCLEVNYTGDLDWSFPLAKRLEVAPFDQFHYALDVKLEQPGQFSLSCIAYDAQGEPLKWIFAPLQPDPKQTGWQHLEGYFVVPSEYRFLLFRMVGALPVRFYAANPLLEKVGNLSSELAPVELPLVTLRNSHLQLVINPRNWSFIATLPQNGERFRSFNCSSDLEIRRLVKKSSKKATFEALVKPFGAFKTLEDCKPAKGKLTIELNEKEPGFSLKTSLPPDYAVGGTLKTVPALAADYEHTLLVIPLNEGRAFDCASSDILHREFRMYAGNELSMPWWGFSRADSAAAMCWTLDADDALLLTGFKRQGPLASATAQLEWQSQKGKWGYDRTAHFWFTPQGGYVALCKHYRQVAEAAHKVVTLAEKAKRLPQLEQFKGAPDLWLFLRGQEALDALKWLHSQGVDHLLDSSATSKERVLLDQKLGFISSVYNIYQDTWDPANLKRFGVGGRTVGFPDDVIMLKDGSLMHGWVRHTAKGPLPGYVICGTQHLKAAKIQIPKECADKPYTAHFIDTTTAAALYECYNPGHPCTRTGEKAGKYALLKYVQDSGLICGSETGLDWAVPVVCYFEGMLSLTEYRHPQAGYLTLDKQPNPETVQYQLNPAVRLPLWELVYHDCVVSTWYWGDSNNQFPSLWHKRDLFNALYATPPLFMVRSKEEWEAVKEGIVRTYKFLEPVLEKAGYAKMVDHRFLSKDRLLQLTEFDNGVGVVVNFSTKPRYFQHFLVKPESYRLLVRTEATRFKENTR